MSINLRSWRVEIPGANQGVHESWEFLSECVTGKRFRSHRTEAEPPWDLNPDYQRGPVWTPEHQGRFIGHVLAGGVQPPIYVQRYRSIKNSPVKEYWTVPEEVIDGQQRLRAITAFMTGEVPALVQHETGPATYWYEDMDRSEQSFSILYSVIIYVDIKRADRLRFYLRLNGEGIPHTAEELSHVRALLAEEMKNRNA